MKLLTLTLDNFKGIRHFVLDTAGRSVIVKAANGAGKTTLQDAYWWLLTGKNAELSADFDVYPYDAPAGAEASVAGTFRLDDGTEFSLTRIFKQRIERRRGDTESTPRGNKTEYLINGVPKSQSDYKAFCNEHFGSDVRMLMLSKLHYFPVDLNWNDRRQTLIDLFAPHLDDIEIIKAHKELEPLGGYIGAMTTVADYAQQAKVQRKKLKERIEQIPARIDEANNAKPDIPEEADPAQLPAIAKRKIKLNNTIASLTNGEGVATLRKRIADLEAKAAEAQAEYMRENVGGNENLQRQAGELRGKLNSAEMSQEALRLKKKNCEDFLRNAEEELQELRKKATAIHYEKFDPSEERCPYCGQTLPQNRIDDLQAEFNRNKARRLDEVTTKGKDLAALRTQQEDCLKQIDADIMACTDRINTINDHLRAVTKMIVTPKPWEETTDARAYAVEIDEYKKQLTQIDALTAKQLESARSELADVEAQFAKISSRTAVIEQREKIEARIRELMDEEKRLGTELARLEMRLELTERFVQIQAQDIEDKINASFEGVRWVLFDRQVNGGIAPCCRAMLLDQHGLYVDYGRNANTANTYNGGLHIIEGLAKATEHQLPVWIDKAECCTTYEEIDNQVIRLQVSAEHPEICVEVL